MIRTFLIGAALIGLFSQIPAVEAPPAAATLQPVLTTIRAQVKENYGAPSARVADALLRSALTEREPVMAYAYLRETIRVATEVGDSANAQSAVTRLTTTFAVDRLDEQAAVVPALAGSAKTVPNASVAAHFALRTCREAALAGNAVMAARMAAVAVTLGARHKDPALKDEAKDLAAWVPEHAQSLATLPVDDLLGTLTPTAASRRGRHLCMLEGDWAGGLPLLRQGSDAALASLATTEFASQRTAAQTLELADDWWSLAQKLRGHSRQLVQRHAAGLYRTLVPTLSGITLARVAQRLAALPLDVTATPGSIDLWPLLALQPGSFKGEWTNENGDLVVAENDSGDHLTIPLVPLGNYRFETSFTHVGGKGEVMMLIPVPHPTGPLSLNMFIFDRDGGGLTLHRIADEMLVSKEKRVSLRHGVRHHVTVEVTTTVTLNLRIWFDDLLALSWSGEAGTAMRSHTRAPPSVPGALGVGAWKAKVAFHHAGLTMLNGRTGTLDELGTPR